MRYIGLVVASFVLAALVGCAATDKVKSLYSADEKAAEANSTATAAAVEAGKAKLLAQIAAGVAALSLVVTAWTLRSRRKEEEEVGGGGRKLPHADKDKDK